MRSASKLLILCSYVALLCAGNAFAGDRIGVIGAANKNITAIGQDTNKRDLKLGDDIFFKDTISADKTGNAQLLFVDKSALTIGANSSVIIDEFVYNPSTSSGNMVMQGTKGTFRFIGGALSKKDAVKIKTPVGTIGIRGGIAIVQINPDTGATNATFVYGNMLTFQNMAGDTQTVTNTGAGIKLDTPTSAPTVFQMTTTQMAAQVGALAGKVGTTGGAAVVPTEKDIGKALITGDGAGGDATNTEGGKGPDGKNNGDGKKEGKPAGDGKNGNNNGGNNTNGNNQPKTGAATGTNDQGAKLTSDGGYVDSNGKYHTPAELAAERAAGRDPVGNPNNPNGTNANNNGGYVAGGATGGAYGTTAGPNGPIQLTSDGGYKDANGNYHTPAELAAYRAANPGANPAPVTGGGYVAGGTAATGGYYGAAPAPAAGTGYVAGGANTYNNGAYAPTAPAAGGYNGYVAPTYSGTATGTYGGGPTYGGYVPPSGGYIAPAGSYNTYNNYAAPYAPTAPYGGTNYYAPAYNNYAAPYGGTNYYNPNPAPYYGPATGGYNYYDPSTYNSTNNYVVTIDNMAIVLRNDAYNRAINAGASGVQATAAGVAAETYFRNSIANGSEINAADTATRVNTTTYITTNFPAGSSGGTTYVATAKPPVAGNANYSNAVAVGTAAYVAARSTHDHAYSMGQGNAAYNNALVNYEQADENTDALANLTGTTSFKTAGEDILDHVNNSTAISSSLLTPQLSGNQALDIEDDMIAARAACAGGCAFVNWDYWAKIQPNASTTAMPDLQGQIVPYVYGTITPVGNLNAPGNVSAVYTGSSLLTTNSGTQMGTIQANIDFNGAGAASLTGFQFGVNGVTLNSGVVAVDLAVTNSAFSGLAVAGPGGPNQYTGTVNGALFGPAAQNIGGNMTFNNGAGGVTGAGVYIGAK